MTAQALQQVFAPTRPDPPRMIVMEQRLSDDRRFSVALKIILARKRL
jgi:hypothetical protein